MPLQTSNDTKDIKSIQDMFINGRILVFWNFMPRFGTNALLMWNLATQQVFIVDNILNHNLHVKSRLSLLDNRSYTMDKMIEIDPKDFDFILRDCTKYDGINRLLPPLRSNKEFKNKRIYQLSEALNTILEEIQELIGDRRIQNIQARTERLRKLLGDDVELNNNQLFSPSEFSMARTCLITELAQANGRLSEIGI